MVLHNPNTTQFTLPIPNFTSATMRCMHTLLDDGGRYQK